MVALDFTLTAALTTLYQCDQLGKRLGERHDRQAAQRMAAETVARAGLVDLWRVIIDPDAPASARYQVVVTLLEKGNSYRDGEALSVLKPQLDDLKSRVVD